MNPVTDAEKVKEWDEVDKYFKRCNEVSVQFKSPLIPNDIPLKERIIVFTKHREPAARSRGAMDIMRYVKHTRPFIEFLKTEEPRMVKGDGIDMITEFNAVGKYFRTNNIEFPKDWDIAVFIELFCYLLRACGLLKEERISDQAAWEVLASKDIS